MAESLCMMTEPDNLLTFEANEMEIQFKETLAANCELQLNLEAV